MLPTAGAQRPRPRRSLRDDATDHPGGALSPRERNAGDGVSGTRRPRRRGRRPPRLAAVRGGRPSPRLTGPVSRSERSSEDDPERPGEGMGVEGEGEGEVEVEVQVPAARRVSADDGGSETEAGSGGGGERWEDVGEDTPEASDEGGSSSSGAGEWRRCPFCGFRAATRGPGAPSEQHALPVRASPRGRAASCTRF